jgi:hypothetical protein
VRGLTTVKKEKAKRAVTIKHDESRPTKEPVPSKGSRQAAAEVPAYDGPQKTNKVPKRSRGKRDRIKAAFKPEKGRRPRASEEADRGQQRPRRGRRGDEEQYIRLRIRVRNGRLSVVDSHLVEGPLGQVTGFPGSNAYEVTLGDELLHAGALPDLGVQRSFPNLKGPAEQRGHYFTERDVFEFYARLPAAAVTRKTLGEITVRLLRVKEEAQADRVGEVPLSTQFEREVRPVAELVGLPESALPQAIDRRGARTPRP